VNRVRANTCNRKTNQCTHNGMRGRYRPATGRCNHQPYARCQQRSEHTENQNLRLTGDTAGINNAFADGGRDVSSSDESTGKFENSGDQDGLFDRNGTGTNRGTHCVGDIICANTPGHVKAENNGQNHKYKSVFSNDFH